MSNDKQQTAVTQFAIALYEGGYLRGNGDEIETLLNRFKEMEKEQIIKACDAGFDSSHLFIEDMKYKSAEEYYEQTYGGNK
jgi:hypothetical protein